MSLLRLRLGVAITMLFTGALAMAPAVQAQDEATLANTANREMQRMADNLAAALSASSSTAALADVRAAISAGEAADAALQALHDIATDDVVRSRSKASLDQTSSAVNKATAALTMTGDAFRSQVQAALAEVTEAIAEFAPVLPLVEQAPQALPKSGQPTMAPAGLAALALMGIALSLAGASLRRRARFA